MKPHRIDTETQRRMDVAFYGALAVINRHKKPGEALHPVPEQYAAQAVDVETLPHYPLIEGDDYGV